MQLNEGLKKIKEIMARRKNGKKPPAHRWQETALRVIEELGVPNSKRNSVFRVCKIKPVWFIERCLTETKELCREGTPWKYFFKLIGNNGQKDGQGMKRKTR